LPEHGTLRTCAEHNRRDAGIGAAGNGGNCLNMAHYAPAPSITEGLLVLVQLVMAAITTAP